MLIKVNNNLFKWKLTENSDVMGSFVVHKFKTKAEIWSFGIFGQYRDQGYGQQMLKEAIASIQEPEIALYVYKTNHPAIHVYEKAGFKIVGEFMTGQAWKMQLSRPEKAISTTNERERVI